MKSQLTYVIRNANTKQMVDCYEGQDGKKHAEERVVAHNEFNPNNLWKLCEELI